MSPRTYLRRGTPLSGPVNAFDVQRVWLGFAETGENRPMARRKRSFALTDFFPRSNRRPVDGALLAQVLAHHEAGRYVDAFLLASAAGQLQGWSPPAYFHRVLAPARGLSRTELTIGIALMSARRLRV